MHRIPTSGPQPIKAAQQRKHQMTLNGKQKNNLRAQAHHLDPQIQIGKNGLTPEQVTQIKKALNDHELIKIKFNAHKNQKTTLSQEITTKTESEQIDLIGNTLIIYKKHPDPEKRQINPDSK